MPETLSENIYGTYAYQYGSAAPAVELPVYPDAAGQPEAQPRVRVRTAARSEARNRLSVSVFALLGVPAVLLSLALMLGSYTRLTQISDESAELEKKIAELQKTNNRLQIDYESAFDMSQVEVFAKTTLGMVKADADQTTYLRRESGDEAKILTRKEKRAEWRQQVDSLFRQLQAYFR